MTPDTVPLLVVYSMYVFLELIPLENTFQTRDQGGFSLYDVRPNLLSKVTHNDFQRDPTV